MDLRIRLHLELLYSCALRNAEAVALDVADLDLDERTVLVRDGKGGKSRMLPMLASTLHAAADYDKAMLAFPVEPPSKSPGCCLVETVNGQNPVQ